MIRIALVLLMALTPLLADDEKNEEKAKEALATFEKEFQSKKEADRVAAVRKLSRVEHASVIEKLGTLMTSDEDQVRLAAIKASLQFKGRKEVVHALMAAVAPNQDHEKVQLAALEGLGETGDPAVIPPLTEYLKELIPRRQRTDEHRALTALYSIEKVHTKASFDAVLDLAILNSKAPGTTAQGQDDQAYFAGSIDLGCHNVLDRLVKQHFANFEHYKAWWAENEARFDDHLKPKD